MCLSEQDAAAVAAKVAEYVGDRAGPDHTVVADGHAVEITYFDKRFPLDVADMAAEEQHASDDAAARVIASL
ncbi:hypothetical protein ACFFMN_22880 [Planobispora siamensis]|nr:hypothetical protein [Planobispora siamensis]